MTMLTRRSALTGAIAATVAGGSLASSPARAAAPVAGRQVPGVYRYKVGSIEITVVTDGVNRMPLTDAFVLNAKKEEVSAALAAAFMDKDVFVGPYNPIVINTGSKLAVVDTGTGEAAFNASKGMNGQFLTNLAAAGIDPNTIDTVIISHYHGDHINGLLKADKSLAYPKAEILVPAPEHKYWMDDGEMSRSATPRIKGAFENARRVMSGEVLKRLPHRLWRCRGTPLTSSPPAAPKSMCRPTSPTRRSCSRAIRAGTRSTTTSRCRRRQPAARSTTCSPPSACRCRDSIIPSRRSPTSRRPQPAIARSRRPGAR